MPCDFSVDLILFIDESSFTDELFFPFNMLLILDLIIFFNISLTKCLPLLLDELDPVLDELDLVGGAPRGGGLCSGFTPILCLHHTNKYTFTRIHKILIKKTTLYMYSYQLRDKYFQRQKESSDERHVIS